MSAILFVVIASLLIILFAIRLSPRYKRLLTVLSLFKPENIAHNFVNMANLFPVQEIAPSKMPTHFELDSTFTPPTCFTHGAEDFNTQEYIASSQTNGLIVIRENTVLYESYFKELTAEKQHISWSVCKSIVSALVGIAVDKGMIHSIEDPVEKYVPYLKGSGYEGTTVKNVLQMSTGIHFNEDYHDFRSDINKLGRVFALGRSFDAYVKSLRRHKAQGTFHDYISMDTQVLGMIVREASGMGLSAFTEEYLWKPIGAEHAAYWLTDRKGMEAAFGGMNCTLRDFARFAQLYLNDGVVNGKQVIPKQWIYDSTHSKEVHLQPGDIPELSSHPFGYGYQWWLPESATGEFLAMGVYSQFIYVDPTHKIIIVKNSSNFNYAIEKRETTFQHLSFFRGMRDQVLHHH